MKYFGVQESSFTAQKYPRYDLDEDQCALVKISVANVKDYTFKNGFIVGDVMLMPGEAWVYMAKGASRITVQSERFGVQIFEFGESLVQGVTYEMKLKLEIPEDKRRRTIVLADAAFHLSHVSYGAMVALAAKHGTYLHVKSDLNFLSASMDCDDSGALISTGKPPYYKPDVVHREKYSVTAGYMYRVFKPMYSYVGLGYGNRLLAWETIDGELVRNVDHSTEGVALEIGAIGTFKNIALSVGCQTINFKYAEVNVGCGVIF